MPATTVKIQARGHSKTRRNLLLRYKQIKQEFEKYDCTEIPITVIWKKYIYPKFFISRSTLYTVLNTDVEAELSQLGYATT